MSNHYYKANDTVRYEFDVEFDIPVSYPKTAPEIGTLNFSLMCLANNKIKY